tara:strand:- start:291 stop:761 length:471 start_codon:yes stop_codon:yes gene_type:complete
VGDLSRNLSWSEVLRASGYSFLDEVPADVRANMERTAVAFQAIRDEFGDPLRVVSGLRSPSSNRAAGGARRSRHMTGEALDLCPADPGRIPELYDIIAALQADGAIEAGGLGCYRRGTYSNPGAYRFLHFDVRRRRARWSKMVEGRWTSCRKDKLA